MRAPSLRRAPARSRSPDRRSARASRLIGASSIAAGSIRNRRRRRAAARARAGLAEARIDSAQAFDAMPPHQQLVDRGGGLLDRAAGHVDHRPMHARQRRGAPRAPRPAPPRYRCSRSPRCDRSMLSRLRRSWISRSGSLVSPTISGLLRLQQLRRQRHAGHKRHVRGLDAAIGEIEAGRGLRGARHADETDIGIVDAPARLAVIVVEREGHRVDAGEILAVEQMLLARHAAALAAEIGGERADHRIEHRDRRHLQAAATFLQQLAQRVVDHREQHEAGIGLDPGDDPLDLAAGAHHAPDMLDRLRFVELHETGPRHRMHRFAGRIRDQMQVKAGQRTATRCDSHPRRRVDHSMVIAENCGRPVSPARFRPRHASADPTALNRARPIILQTAEIGDDLDRRIAFSPVLSGQADRATHPRGFDEFLALCTDLRQTIRRQSRRSGQIRDDCSIPVSTRHPSTIYIL